ncbi:MAG: NAD(P)H:quinone oxidoreductase [Proteobacteria bacterium]|jgi:NAD(P)H dehydrogenase (quinone)|nr:NAD(P)H:quinone oxidoreductase [Pseudomonadota bacterium]
MTTILVLYYSKEGAVKAMAQAIALGINSINGVEAKIRTVPDVYANVEEKKSSIPDTGSIYATLDDLIAADGLALGSPTRFGNMAAPLKYFIESTSSLWFKGALENKPATVFTSTGSLHGGNEATLLTMQIPLLHLGMIIMGVPYSIPELSTTSSGGTPYGASHVSIEKGGVQLSDEERKICIAQGKRIAKLAHTIKNSA